MAGCIVPKVSCEAAITIAVRVLVSFESSSVERSHSKLTRLGIGRMQLLTGCWPEVASGPCHMGLSRGQLAIGQADSAESASKESMRVEQDIAAVLL